MIDVRGMDDGRKSFVVIGDVRQKVTVSEKPSISGEINDAKQRKRARRFIVGKLSVHHRVDGKKGMCRVSALIMGNPSSICEASRTASADSWALKP